MATKIEIYKLAGTVLREARILAVTDNTNVVRTFDDVYALCRDGLLEDKDWSFAIFQDTLATIAETPLFGFAYVAAEPTGCLRITKTEGDVPYRVKDNKVYSNYDPLVVEYLKYITDESKFSADFARCLAYSVALAAAPKITQDEKLIDRVEKWHKSLLSKARFQDALKGGTPPIIEATDWIDAR